MSAVAAEPARTGIHWRRLARRHGWTVGVYLLLVALILYWRTIPAGWGTFDVQSLAIDALPFAFAAIAQAVVVISGGIDLSIGSLMSLINVVSAKYMFDATTGQAVSFREAILLSFVLILGGALAGVLTGVIITVTKVADIIVTLAMLFVWGGAALAVMQIPGGGAPLEFTKLARLHADTLAPVRPRHPRRRRADRPCRPLAQARAYALRDRRGGTSFLAGISVARTRSRLRARLRLARWRAC
jgi:ribose/xylose/arabinose/galactoside ABC-type transport system permease subunit